MRQDVAAYMKYYNMDRLYSSNGDVSPIHYEKPLEKESSLG